MKKLQKIKRLVLKNEERFQVISYMGSIDIIDTHSKTCISSSCIPPRATIFDVKKDALRLNQEFAMYNDSLIEYLMNYK